MPLAVTHPNLPWVGVHKVSNIELIQSLAARLDSGEAAALALAIEVNADLLLVDERRARLEALRHRIKVIGLLGVLLEARKRGLLQRVQPVLNDLTSKARGER